jgi:hypothetical protein
LQRLDEAGQVFAVAAQHRSRERSGRPRRQDRP